MPFFRDLCFVRFWFAEKDRDGPQTLSPPSVSPNQARVGTEVTRTQGTYAPRGGGTVDFAASEFRMDGAQVATGATHTPDPADVGKIFTYYEIPNETGGSSPGPASPKSITIGIVKAQLTNEILDMSGEPILDMAGNPIFDMAA